MRIIVIEPHADDAYLSMGWHLQKLYRDHERIILTVFSGPKRTNEARKYAAKIGCESITLQLPEVGKMETTRSVKIIQPLRKALNELDITPDDKVYFPLGLQHPDHLDVAATRTQNSYRYLDTPYQTKLKLSSSLQGKADGLSIQSIQFPPKAKWAHIPIFASQGTFFYFTQIADYRGLPEIVLK